MLPDGAEPVKRVGGSSPLFFALTAVEYRVRGFSGTSPVLRHRKSPNEREPAN